MNERRPWIILLILPVLWGLPEPAWLGQSDQGPPGRSTTGADRALEKAGRRVLEERPWLRDLYSWNETFDLSSQEVKANLTGAYCVGNGRAFALVGLSSPLWNWSNIYGDSYQEPDLGSLHMALTRGGSPVWLPRQKIGWVKRSGLVKVEAQGSGLSVESYDFAPVTSEDDAVWNNTPVIIRMVHLTNSGTKTESDLNLELKIQAAWNVTAPKKNIGHDLVLVQKAAKAKKRTVWRLGAFQQGNASISEGNLHYRFPSLPPGGETWAAFFLLSSDTSRESAADSAGLRKKGALSLLDQTRVYFTDWFGQGTEFAGDPKITDLFEIESMIFKSQQSHSGGFSPLIGYSYTWIRDNNGPIRWFLKTGHPREAKGAMDFFYGIASSMGSLPNSVRVDFPLNFRKKDLSDIQVEHAETPNWIVLQHWWYYLTTGDIDLIRARWGYLKRCVEGQVRVEDKYFFHRDETYLWCLESRCFDQCPCPNYDLSTYAFAADSSFDLVAAADRLAYLGKYIEMDKDVSEMTSLARKVRDKAEATYWNEKAGYWAPAQSLLGPLVNAPQANVLINPFWCGYTRNDLDPLGETPSSSGHAVAALRNAYPILGREDGFWKTTPTVDFFVGMNPGQLLYSFSKARLPWAEKAYRAVLKTATPSGEFAEMYDGQCHPWNTPAWGLGTSGRVRPWEGGLNTESLLEFITGFSPDAGNNRVVFSPHLPEDLKIFSAQRLLVGKSQVSFSLKRTGAKEWSVNFHLDKGPSPEVLVDIWASLHLLSNLTTLGSVEWQKTLAETNGREARCRFTLAEGQDQTITVSEGSQLPSGERNPPPPQPFQPEPYLVEPSSLLLLTTPSGIFLKHKNTEPANFPSVGGSELKTMRRVTSSVSFLDMDLPISTGDIASALLDDKGALRTKLAVLGTGAFSSGRHHFKPASYWADQELGKAFKKFLERGGILFLGPAYSNREILPEWLIHLTQGGWEVDDTRDEAVPSKEGGRREGPALAELFGFVPGLAAGKVDHGLTAKGPQWASLVALSKNPGRSAVILQKVGKGLLIRSELRLEDSVQMLKSFLRPTFWTEVNSRLK